jgi:hypothetical protein
MRNTRNVLILTIILTVLVAGCISQLAPTQMMFAGKIVNFRADLREAKLVETSNPVQLKQAFFQAVDNVYISFISNDNENGFYAVTGFELSYKILSFRNFYGLNWNVTAMPINSTDEIPQDNNLYVVMLGPSLANETSVSLEENIIYVNGKDFYPEGKKYTELDLAADKLLLILLED